MSGNRGTNDLSCNETLIPEEERPSIPGIPGSIQPNRRFTATNPHNQGAFRVNYPASGNTPPQKTYTAIARPVASRSYSVANTTTPRTVIGNSAYQAGPSGSSAGGSGQRGFVAPNVPSRNRHPSLHDDAPHITFTTSVPAAPAIIRNPSRFIPPNPPPNPFVNSLRLTQAPPAPPSTGSKTAQGLLNVVQSMPRHSSSPSLNQFGSNLFGRSFSPTAAHRGSTNLLGTTSLHGATNSLLGQVPTSPAIQRVQTSTPQSFLQGASSGFVHPSPTLMGVHQNTVNTPSPRPSILRKPTTPGSAAKRKLGFMDNYPTGTTATTLGTSASPSISSVRSIIQNTNDASTSVAKALGSVGTPNNGTEGESPRKRQRKQQFDNSQYEPMMMAVGVEPVKTPIWELPRDHPLAQEYFRNMHLPTEKKKRGRPRADASGKTGTPADQFMVQTGVRRVFVPMDQLPNQALSQIAQQQNQLLNPGMPAADAVAAAIQAAGLQNLQTQAVTSRYLGGTPLQNVNPKQTVKEVLMKAAAEQMRMQNQQKKHEESAPQSTPTPIAAIPTPKEPKACPTPAPAAHSSNSFAIPDIPTTLKTPRQLAAEKKKAEAEAIKAAKAAEIAERAAAKSKARQAASHSHGPLGHFMPATPSTSKAPVSKASTSKAAASKPAASKGKKEPAKKPTEAKPTTKAVAKKTAAQLRAEEETTRRREAAKQKRREKKLAAKKKEKEEWQAIKKEVKEKEMERMKRKAVYKKPVNSASWTLEQKTNYVVRLLARRYLRNIKEKALLQKDAKVQDLGLTEKFFPERYRQVQDDAVQTPSVSKRVEVKSEEFQRPRMSLWKKSPELTDRYNHFKNIELLEKAYEDRQKALKIKNVAGWARNKLRKRCFRRATRLVNRTTKHLRQYYKKHNIPYEPRVKNKRLRKWLQWTLMHRVMDDTKKEFPVLKNLREREKQMARVKRMERRKRVRASKHRRHNRKAEEKRLKQFQADRLKKLKTVRNAGKAGEIEGVHYVIVSSKMTKIVDGKKKTIRVTIKRRIKQELDGVEKDSAVVDASNKPVKKKKKKTKKKENVDVKKKTSKKRKKKSVNSVELNFPLVLMPLKKVFYTKEEFDKHVEENKMKYGGGPFREIQLPEDPVLSIARSFSSVAETVEVVAEEMPLTVQRSKPAAVQQQPGPSTPQESPREELRQSAKMIRSTIPSKAASQLQSVGQPRIAPQKLLLKSNAVAAKPSSSLIGVKTDHLEQQAGPSQQPAARTIPVKSALQQNSMAQSKKPLMQTKKVNEPSACGMLPGPSSSSSSMIEARDTAVRALVESREGPSVPIQNQTPVKQLNKKKKKKSKEEAKLATVSASKSKSTSSEESLSKKPKKPKERRDKTACQIIEKENKPTMEERKAFLRAAVAKFNEKCAKVKEHPEELVAKGKPRRSRPVKYQNTYNYLWQKKMLRVAKAYDKQLYGQRIRGKLRRTQKKRKNSGLNGLAVPGMAMKKRPTKAQTTRKTKPRRSPSKSYASKKALVREYKKKALDELQPVSKKKRNVFKIYPNLDPALIKHLVPDYADLFDANEEPVKKNRMRIWDPVAEQQMKKRKALLARPFTLKDESVVEQAVDEMVSLVSYSVDKDEFEKKLYKERTNLRQEYERPVLPLTSKEYHRLLLAKKSKERQLAYSFKDAFTDAFTEVKMVNIPEERLKLPVDCDSSTAEIVSSYHKTLGWWEAVCGPQKKRPKDPSIMQTRKQKRQNKRELHMKRLKRAVRLSRKREQKQTVVSQNKKIATVTVTGEEAKPTKLKTAAYLVNKLAKMRPSRKVFYIKKLRKRVVERKKVLLKRTDRERYLQVKKQVQQLRVKNKKKLDKLAPFRRKQTSKEIMDKKIKEFVEKSEAERKEKRAAIEAAAKEVEAENAKKAAAALKKKGRPPKRKGKNQKVAPTPSPPPEPVVKLEEPNRLDYKQFLRPIDREYTFADVFADLEKANQERLQKKKELVEEATRKKKEEDNLRITAEAAKEVEIKQEELEERTAGGKKVKVTKGKPAKAAAAKAQQPPVESVKAPETPKKKETSKKKVDPKKAPEVIKKEPDVIKEEPMITTMNKKEAVNLKRKTEQPVIVVASKKKKGAKAVVLKEVKIEELEPISEPVVQPPVKAKKKVKAGQKKKILKQRKRWTPDTLVGTPSSRAAMWRYSRRGFIPMTVKDYNRQKREARRQKRAEGVRRKEFRKWQRELAAARRRRRERRTKERLMAVSENPVVRRQLLKSFQTKMRMEARVRRILRLRKNEEIRKRRQLKKEKLKKCEEIAKAKGVDIKVVKRSMFRVRRQPFYQPTKRDIAIMRLEHLRKQFTEQLEMDRRLLVFFVDLLKTYDPAAYNKLQLDIARDYEPGDTPIMVKRKKWERIRVTLMRPASINLPPPKRPVLFESNDCVIINPSKTTVNQFMKVQSPFWKGPAVRWNKANSRLDRKGNLMADRPDDWKPLDMTPREIYKEDLTEWNTERKLRQCEANMELYWNQYCEQEGIQPDDDFPELPPSLASDPPVYGVNRRTIRYKQDKSEVVWVGGCDRPKLDLIDEDGGVMDDPEAKQYYFHAREMLAISSKNVHEQAIINFHILQKLIDDIVPKTPEEIATMRAAAAAERRRVATPPPPPPPPPPPKSSKSKKKGATPKQPKTKPGKKAKKQQQAAAKAKKEAKKEPPKPRAPKHPRAPRTPVLTESTFERQMRRAIQESLRCMPSTSKAKH